MHPVSSNYNAQVLRDFTRCERTTHLFRSVDTPPAPARTRATRHAAPMPRHVPLTTHSTPPAAPSLAAAQTSGLDLQPTRTLAYAAQEGTWMQPDMAPDGKTILFDLLGDWTPDEATRHRVLVDNPARLYGFAG